MSRDRIRPRFRWSAGGVTSDQRTASEAPTLALTVFVTAIVEIWFAVPAGFALGLHPVLVWVLTVCGSLVSVVTVGTAGDRFRSWLVARGHGFMSGTSRVHRLWVRYGVIGWGLVSPLLVAPAMGTALGLALGAPKRRLLTWMFGGVLIWTTILVTAGVLGIHAFNVVTKG